MKGVTIILLILLVVAVGVSLALIPNDEELALIRFRNKEYEEAFGRYLGMWNSGDRSISVVVPLANLYLTHGDVDHAVEIMEHFVEAHPNNLEARTQLGRYYQYAQRPGDYINNLEMISSQQPSEEGLRELSASHNFEGQYDKQINVLEVLIELYPKNPQNFVDLAYLQASKHLFKDAMETLEQLKEKHPSKYNVDLLSFFCSLAIDANQPDQAFTAAFDWLQTNQEVETVVQLSSLFSAKGESQLAAEFLAPYEMYLDENAAMLREWVRIQISLGELDRAFSRLNKLYFSDRLDQELYPEFLDLSLHYSQQKLVLKLAEQMDPANLESWMQLSVVEVALATGRKKLLRSYISVIPPGEFDAVPVLGAQVALALGNHERAKSWMEEASRSDSLSFPDRIVLAGLFEDQGESEMALSILLPLFDEYPTPRELSYRVAQLFIKLDQIELGCQFFEELILKSSDHETRFAWALLNSNAGNEEAVVKWLTNYTGSVPPEYLTDLYYSGSEGGASQLALTSALQLWGQQPTREHRYLLAAARFETEDFQGTLELVRILSDRNQEEDSLYRSALTEAFKAGYSVEKELTEYWLNQINGANLEWSQREEAAYALIELGARSEVLGLVEELAYDDPENWYHTYSEVAIESKDLTGLTSFLRTQLDRIVIPTQFREDCLYLLVEHAAPEESLPYLKKFAQESTRDWFFVYQEMLLQLDRYDELHQFWKEYVQRTDISDKDRRSVAFELQETGHKKEAEEVFWKLADQGNGEGPDIDQLLYLWGPRPELEKLLWLEQKARSTSNIKEKQNWLGHLFDVGQFSLVVDILGNQQVLENATSSEIFELYARSLLNLRKFEHFDRFVVNQIDQTESIPRLRFLARFAREGGREKISIPAFSKILNHSPNDIEANKVLGTYAFTRGKYSNALHYLEKSLTKETNDFESLFYLGEVYRREGDLKSADKAFSSALLALKSVQNETPVTRLFEAKILNRLDETEISIRLFRLLLSQNPTDINLRADFVSVLMEHRKFDEAEALLQPFGSSDD